MAKAKVNVAAFFEDAMKDNGKEQITYLPIDLLDQNPDNFYSLDGLDELSYNIELIGLQQPIRVRPKEGGRYTIISGHRRRAAIMMIIDGGNDMFKDGIPCIIERGEASPAMQELRLIYANAATRSMTSADLSKQAERVTELLYQLKEEGVEFPGRMRDHVAEACKVSKTKLARLHAIRKNLHPDLLGYFDRNEMNEELAYQMSRLPKEAQAAAGFILKSGKKKQMPYAYHVEVMVKDLEKYSKPAKCFAYAGSPDCKAVNTHIVKSLWEPYRDCWQLTPGKHKDGICCRDCNDKDHCSWACQACKDRRKLNQAVEKEKAAEKAKQEQAEKEIKQKMFRRQRQEQAIRIMTAAEQAGMKDEDELPSQYSWNKGTKIKEIREAADGKFGDEYFYEGSADIIHSLTSLKNWADTLHCSTDWLLGRSDTPEPAKVSEADTDPAGWQLGDPQTKGRYLCTVDLGTKLAEQRCDWNGSEWMAYGRPIADVFKVIAWYPLPAEYRPKRNWDEPEDEDDDDYSRNYFTDEYDDEEPEEEEKEDDL